MTSPVLHTERLVLSAPGPEDMDAMVQFFSEDRAQFYGGPLGPGPAWRRFSEYAGQWAFRGYGFFAVRLKDGGATIGLAGPYHPGDFPEPEMAWLLTSEAYEGKGYAREASTAVLAHLFSDLKWRSVVSYIDPDNHASRALALKLGAEPDRDSPPPPAALPGVQAFRHWPGANRVVA
ncbi:MAG: GNAT family N-acetyltransferase [Pseudomonadota bacterium]